MAKNKVEIDVKVNDNGTTEKVALNSKKAAKGLDDTAKSARTADRNMKGASQQSANGTKNFSKMAQGMQTGLVPAYATLATNIFAVTAVFQALKAAADFRVIKDSQVAFTAATGTGLRSLTADIKSATDGLVGFKDASQAAAIGTASGLSGQQLRDLSEGARNVSLILGRDVTDSFNRLVRGVTKAEPELLDELGITLRLADATEKYASTLGKAANALSLYEKSQAVAVEVQSQLDNKYGAVAASVALQSNQVAKLGVEFEKILHPMQDVLSAMAEPTAKFLGDNIKALTAAFALFAIPIVKAIIPGLNEWGETSRIKAAEAKQAYREAREEIERVKQAQMDLQMKRTQEPGKAAQSALAGVKSKSSGIGKIQAGDFGALSKREIKGLLRAAEQGKGAVRQMSEEMKRTYISALKAMNAESLKTTESIKTYFKNTGASIALTAQKIKATWSAAMAGMQRITALASRAINGLLRFAGVFGILVLLKDLIVEIGQSMGFFQEDEDIAKFAKEFQDLGKKIKATREEFAKFSQVQEDYYKKLRQNKDLKLDLSLPTEDGLAAAGRMIERYKDLFLDFKETIDDFNQFKMDKETVYKKIAGPEKALLSSLQTLFKTKGVYANREKAIAELMEIENISRQKADKRLRALTDTTGNYISKNGTLIVTTQGLLEQIDVQRDKVMKLDKEYHNFLKSLGSVENEEGKHINTLGLEEGMITRLSRKMQNHTNVQQAFTTAKEEASKAATQFAQNLRSSKVATQEGGSELIRLADTLALAGELSEEDSKRFEYLSQQLIGLGATAAMAAKEFMELNRLFDTKTASIGTFQTSVSNQIDRTQALKAMYDPTTERKVTKEDGTVETVIGGELANTAEAKARLQSLGEDLKVLNKIREQEIGIQLRKLGIEKQVNTLMLGASTLEKEQIAVAQQRAEITSQRMALLNNLKLIQEGHIQADEAQVQNLLLQLDILRQQEGQILRNENATLAAIDAMEDSFENKFSSGLADIIKGKESSFGDMLGNAALAGLEAAADSFAKSITKDLFGFGELEPEEKIQNAMVEAADYHKLKIQEAISGTGYDVLQPGAEPTGPGGLMSLNDTKTEITPELTGKDPGSFMGKMENLMGSNAPFIDKLKGAFTLSKDSLVGGLGKAFTSAKNMLGPMFSSMFSSLSGLFSSLPGLLSGALSGLAGLGSSLFSLLPFANGGIAKGGFRSAAYADGGVVKQPTIALMGEGKHDEAVVPLPDGRKIPVEMRNNQNNTNQNNSVVVNISSEGNQTSQASMPDMEEMGSRIAIAVQKELQTQKRSGGILNPYGAS